MNYKTRIDNPWESGGVGWVDGETARQAGLIHGGFNGYAVPWTAWVHNAMYTSRPMLTFLLQAPLAFKLLPDSQRYISTLRSLVETIRHRVDGINLRLDVQTDTSQKVGRAGQTFEVFLNTTVTESNVSMSWWERPGLPVYNFFQFWIRTLMADPETGYAAISTYAGTEAYDGLPDMYTMSMLFVEPDVTHRYCVKAVVGVNMFPKTTGDNEMRYDADNVSQVQEVTIEFSGFYHNTTGTRALGQRMLSSISLVNANVYRSAPAVSEIDAMVADSPMGYAQTVRNISKQQFK